MRISLQEFQKDHLSYYNGIHKYDNLPLNEAQFLANDSRYLDSALNKFESFATMGLNDSIFEAQNNYYFNINEQLALRDTLYMLVYEYLRGLYYEENGINEALSISDIGNWVKEKTKMVKDKVSKGIDALTEKVKAARDFLKDIMSNAIKTVRDLMDKLTDMMIAVGTSVSKFFEKLGLKPKEQEAQFQIDLKNTAALKDIASKCTFESYAAQIAEYGYILEDNEMNEGFKDWAKEKMQQGKQFAKAAWKGIKNADWKKILSKAFLKMLVYYVITLVIPIAVGCVAGPPGAAIAEALGKIIWGTYKCFSIIKREIKYLRSGAYKKKSKWGKVWHWFFFLISIGFTAYTAGVGINESVTKVFKYFADPQHFALAPSAIVQKGMQLVNKVWKEVLGGKENIPGVQMLDEMIAKADAAEQSLIDAMNKNAEAQNGRDEFMNGTSHGNVDLSEVNNMEHIRAACGKALQDKLKEFMDAKGMTSWKDVHNWMEQVQLATPGRLCFAVDANTFAKAVARNPFMKKLMSDDADYTQVWNETMAHAEHFRSGGCAIVSLPQNASPELISKFKETLAAVGQESGVETWCTCLSAAAEVGPLPDLIQTLQTSFLPFGGLGDLWDPVAKNGEGFRVRLGKKGSKKYVYEIGEGGIEEISVKDARSKFQTYNKAAWSQYEKLVNNINKTLESYQQKLEKDQKDQRESSQIVDQRIEQLKKAMSEYKLIVFKGKQVEPKPEKKETNESLVYGWNEYIFEEDNPERDKATIGSRYEQYLSYFTVLAIYDITDESDKKKLSELLDELRKKFTDNIVPLIDDDKFAFGSLDGKILIVAKNAENSDIKTLAKRLTLITHPDKNKELIELIEKIQKKYKIKSSVEDDVEKDKEDKYVKVNPNKVLTNKQQQKLIGLTDVPAVIDKKDTQIIPVPKEKALSIIPKVDPVDPKPEPKDDPVDPKPKPKDDPEDDTEYGEEVLFFSPICMCGADLNKSDEKGPRGYIYYMKNLYNSLEFIEIEDGAAKSDIEKMLTDMMNESIKASYNCVADEPCIKKDGKGKYVVNDKSIYKDAERDDFGSFKNSEITDLMNNPKNMKNYLGEGGISSPVAESPEEEEELADMKKDTEEKIRKDDKVKEYIKDHESLAKVIDKHGNYDKEELDKLSDAVANYRMARRKKKKKGFWGKIKSFFKNMFSSNDYKSDDISGLNDLLSESVNESYDDFLEFLNS